MTQREALYITVSGYGPCSTFALATWLTARDRLKGNRESAIKNVMGKRSSSND